MKKILFVLLAGILISSCGMFRKSEKSNNDEQTTVNYAENISKKEKQKLVLPPNYDLRPVVSIEKAKTEE